MVNGFGIDQGFFTTDAEWMGNGWDFRQPALGLSGSYLCDPWLMGLESTKAFFTTDRDRIGGRMGTKAAAEKMK